jgi:shikimate kinase
MNAPAQPIVITGFMGAGKTTVATALAKRLECAFIDLDRFIADREMRTAQVIIDEDGEEQFRRIETGALRAALETAERKIIALGGGTSTIAENREVLNEHDAISVWLDVPFEVCWRRIVSEGISRPLARDFATASSLYETRRPSYQQATLRIIVSDEMSIEQVTTEIVNWLAE